MKKWHFESVWDLESWKELWITTDDKGKITDVKEKDHGETELVNGWLIPGIPNTHSHAFQFAIVGTSEHGNPAYPFDDFWSWRETMYDLALRVTPPQMEKIASALYVRFLERGFTSVLEFHYLHGENHLEFVEALSRAATETGIALTAAPVYYEKGGFGEAPKKGQKRFLFKSVEAYLAFLESAEKTVKKEGHTFGSGIHSLRAVSPESAKAIFYAQPKTRVFHLHVAEQLKEVEGAVRYLEKRPVAWALNALDLDHRCHLVHATHVMGSELDELVKRKVSVVFCPTTEENLGDGIFPFREYAMRGGTWSIGTDSHVGIDPFEELRVLDCVQRLRCRNRGTGGAQDRGTVLLKEAIRTGHGACGTSVPTFKVGEILNGLVLGNSDPLYENVLPAHRLSIPVFSGGTRRDIGVIRGGRWVVRNGVHEKREEVEKGLRAVLRELRGVSP